jgi:hypothetical protein
MFIQHTINGTNHLRIRFVEVLSRVLVVEISVALAVRVVSWFNARPLIALATRCIARTGTLRVVETHSVDDTYNQCSLCQAIPSSIIMRSTHRRPRRYLQVNCIISLKNVLAMRPQGFKRIPPSTFSGSQRPA